MDNSVISLAFSKDSELLASGSTDGVIAVSNIEVATVRLYSLLIYIQTIH